MQEPRAVRRLPDGEHERLVAFRRLDGAPIPPEAPGRCADPVGAGIDRGKLERQEHRPVHCAGEETDSAVVVVKLLAELLHACRSAGLSIGEDVVFGPRQRQHRAVVLVLEQHDVSPGDPGPGLRSRGAAEPLPQHWRRGVPGGDGCGERNVRRIHELAQVNVRQIERLTHLVVAVAALVLGQQLLDAQFREMEKVSQGVFIFLPREPSVEPAAGLGDLRRVGQMEPIIQHREDGGRLRSRRQLVGLGRHLAGGDPVVHPLPESKVLGIVHRHRKRVEVETALLRGRVMAFEAMVLEEAPEPRVRRRSRRGHDSEGE